MKQNNFLLILLKHNQYKELIQYYNKKILFNMNQNLLMYQNL